MEQELENKKCKNHPDKSFDFYCFEDSFFLCSECFFNQHRNHNVEVIENLKENIKLFEKIKSPNKSLKDLFTNYKKGLEKVKKEIEEELVVVSKLIEKLNSNSVPGINKNSIFSLSYNEYKSINEILERTKKKNEIVKLLSLIANEFHIKIKKVPSNFRIISEEVKVLENSPMHSSSDYSVDIMFGRKNGKFTLFNGAKNHYLVLDLGNKFYLKSIKINTCVNCECIPKNIKVSIKNESNNKWVESNKYVCKKYDPNIKFQGLSIMKEARYLRIDFLDNWGLKGGNFILIKRILFEIGDMT